ncbi:hypothetical protein ColLi_06851 [Colletotrichum liriopes]|uniref:Uncharacterized protein n=1 Tax=Colletotrichum liriopes TaxID=708192 RepID=A0AA37LU24_9PEZI|nr:hypothetical protein ColLi_06851 [Colletotrichum liriopes]
MAPKWIQSTTPQNSLLSASITFSRISAAEPYLAASSNHACTGVSSMSPGLSVLASDSSDFRDSADPAPVSARHVCCVVSASPRRMVR